MFWTFQYWNTLQLVAFQSSAALIYVHLFISPQTMKFVLKTSQEKRQRSACDCSQCNVVQHISYSHITHPRLFIALIVFDSKRSSRYRRGLCNLSRGPEADFCGPITIWNEEGRRKEPHDSRWQDCFSWHICFRECTSGGVDIVVVVEVIVVSYCHCNT